MDKNENSELNSPAPDAIDLLLSRRSGSAKSMKGPGPNGKELQKILTAGARVPDHKKLFPWRFVVFEGDARKRAGKLLVEVLKQEEHKVSKDRLNVERGRFLRAPLVIAVISIVRENIPILEWEQMLSAGAACQNILIAAHALGFVGNWLTEWYAFDPQVKNKLGLTSGERVAGFIYIGKADDKLEERARPDLEKFVSRF